MRRLVLLPLVALLLCAGCAKRLSMEPASPEDTLVVGRIMLEASGLEEHNGIPTLNGLHENNIELTFRYIPNDETFTVVSKYGGLFYKSSLQPGTYGLVKLSLKVSGENGYATVYRSFKWPPFVFTIEPGKVTNLGCLSWHEGDDDGGPSVRQDYAPGILREYLAEKFPDSAWLARECIEVEVK